jgi:hypothetical protein
MASTSPFVLRWAVNVERWEPEEMEWRFLLGLVPQEERDAVLKCVWIPASLALPNPGCVPPVGGVGGGRGRCGAWRCRGRLFLKHYCDGVAWLAQAVVTTGGCAWDTSSVGFIHLTQHHQ